MLKRMTEYLDRNSIKYVVTTHSPAFTASEVADTIHVAGKDVAKTVMLYADGKMCMAVLSSSCMIDLGLFRNAAGATEVELATESDFRESFPECEVGAMPPFGNLFGFDVIIDRALAESHEIVFNAGNHREAIRMAYPDFARLVKPRVCSFGVKRIRHEDDVPSA